ncbi:MAG: sugar nucleotide-binding protein [Planctomycetales bacterium]|nr:sugar nucleotide-binding protein [Planctomycetales bacterium]NIM10032.1 sugar nucleotide-binding protein [Planctomycetales bacterium]NIN09473.1 sugar nucleotide-binding protein [Planctomycetales bacterium]NIN78581.1 sugar nucleotide-binding protein [Planctomycetales bacterium]NIO35775.1 sugar nucleotide-binding protein [Planctomycetales bacterium]
MSVDVALAPPPLPLLVTGVAGVAGYNALEYFHSRYPGQVIGVRQIDNWPLSAPHIVPCNAEDREGLQRLFDHYQFRSVLNCAGNCALKSCELDPPLAWRTNVQGIRNLLTVLNGGDVRLVHLSIDLVFSGRANGGHVERDAPDPVTEYGHSMAAAERLVLIADPRACILRISLPMGISFNGHAGAIDWIQSRFKKSLPATLYFDEIRTPTYTDCLNRLFHVTLAGALAGLYHAGGPRRLSLYEIAQIVNRVGGYDPRHLHGCPRIQAGPIPPRAGNVSLDSTRLAHSVGFQPFDPWPLDNRWLPTHRAWHFERPPHERGSPQLLAEILYRNPAKASRSRVI